MEVNNAAKKYGWYHQTLIHDFDMIILTSASSKLHLEALEVSGGLDALNKRHSQLLGYDVDRNMKDWRPSVGGIFWGTPLESRVALQLYWFIRSVSNVLHGLKDEDEQKKWLEYL